MRTPRDPELAADRPPIDARGPIFIAGLSKSGKTELRRVLEQHADLTMTRRARLWHTLPGRYGDLADPRSLGRCLDAIESSPEGEELGFDRPAIVAEFAEGPPSYERLLALVHEHHASRCGTGSWGVQLREIEHRAESLISQIPGTKLIHMVRDPRVRASQCARAGGHIVGGVGWETAKWLDSARLAVDGVSRWPSQYLVVRSEDMVADPTETLGQVMQFIGLRDDPLVDQAIRIVDWSVLGPAEVDRGVSAFVESVVGPEMGSLGYRPGSLSEKPTGWIDGWLGFRLSRVAIRGRLRGTRRRA